MDPWNRYRLMQTRRHFFGATAAGIGTAALGSLLQDDLQAGRTSADGSAASVLPRAASLPHFAPTAKRVIWLFQSGGPSQMDLFDYKPALARRRGEELPDSIRQGQRLTSMTSEQGSFPVAPSIYEFAQHGQSGAWISELLPRTAEIADNLCFIRSMHTEAINHDPAVTFLLTGAQIAGRPSLGAWLAYGLGNENSNLPAFVVMVTQGTGGQPLYDRLWGSGFLPSRYQGVKFRSVGDPGPLPLRSQGLRTGEPPALPGCPEPLEPDQAGGDRRPRDLGPGSPSMKWPSGCRPRCPRLTDLSGEPEHIFRLYGEDARKPGTFASNCLLARRLAERGVRFIQVFHRGWDQHGKLPTALPRQCKATDQASAALVQDLKQRGMLEDTLVIWGGEFGRTVYCQGPLTETDYGRDHHPRCFTIWMTGGGVRPGVVLGETDEFSYNITKDPVHVHDLQATLLHCLGIDHTKLTYKYQGRHFRLTDVHGEVINRILA